MDISIFDRLLALTGFGLTIWQLYKTRSAALAARESANQAVSSIKRLEAATKMHDISSRSRELLRLLRNKSLDPAASAAFELRDTMARYRHDQQSQLIVSSIIWDKAVSDVKDVHERLESLAMVARIRPEDREILLHEVARLHTLFTSLAAQAGANGVTDAYPN